MFELDELYQDLIIDHGKNPRNFGCLENADCCKEGYNPLCGDKMTLYLNLHDDKVTKASFSGNGCAISMASASLMTEALPGLTRAQVEKLFHDFHLLLTQDDISQIDQEKLGKLMALAGVKVYPMRVKCATLAWHTLISAINEQKGTVTTE